MCSHDTAVQQDTHHRLDLGIHTCVYTTQQCNMTFSHRLHLGIQTHVFTRNSSATGHSSQTRSRNSDMCLYNKAVHHDTQPQTRSGNPDMCSHNTTVQHDTQPQTRSGNPDTCVHTTQKCNMTLSHRLDLGIQTHVFTQHRSAT